MADLPTQSDFQDFDAWAGRDVLAPGGDRLGAVDQIFLDEATGTPEWVLVTLDDGAAFVPLAGATVEERSIRVDQDAERVQAAPRPEAGETLSVADEKRLYEHYGLEYSQRGVLDRAARGRDHGGAAAAAASTSARRWRRPRRKRPRRRRRPQPAAAEEPKAAESPASRAAESRSPRPTPWPRATSATPRPPPCPRASPRCSRPQGGFRHEVEESRGSKLRTAIPIALAGAIAGLIAVLAWRRRR